MQPLKQFSFILMLFLVFLFSQKTEAQQKLRFDVVKFQLNQLDGTASNPLYQKVDGSGNPYAIIKVRATDGEENLNGFMFDFNSLKSSVENKGDELWVYVQKNAKIVTISRDGYNTLRNFDLGQTLQAGKTYNMEITYDLVEKVVKKELHMQMLQFNITPAVEGTIVMYKKNGAANYELFGEVDGGGNVAKNLNYGTYDYQIISDNYFTSEGRVVLNSDSAIHVEHVMLKSNFSEITLKTTDAADIYVDNEFKAKGSWTGMLKGGEHVVECRQESHRASSKKIKVETNVAQSIELDAPIPLTGYVSVTSVPSGATVEIDGIERGKTPCNIKDVLIGSRKITLKMQNYNPSSTNVYIEEGKVSNIKLTLDNVLTAGVESTPTGAQLYMNGEYRGVTPYSGSLVPGNYQVELKCAGYEDYTKNVIFNSNNPVHYAQLTKKNRFNRKTCCYLQGNYTYAVNGKGSAIGASFGAYISNFNIQIDFYKINADYYYDEWYGGSYYEEYETCDEIGYGFRLGYGIPIIKRLRLTPQIGWMCGDGIEGNHVAKLALRMELNLFSWLGINVTPEYDFKIETYEGAEYYDGFKINAGMHINF